MAWPTKPEGERDARGMGLEGAVCGAVPSGSRTELTCEERSSDAAGVPRWGGAGLLRREARAEAGLFQVKYN